MMGRMFKWLGVVSLIVCASSAERAIAQDPCAGGACCVNPATCVVTDKQTLAALTVDSVFPCTFTLGSYCTGGSGLNGISPSVPGACGLSWLIDNATTPAVALDSLDHRWLQSTTVPKVVDFGAPINTAVVFVAVDNGSFPEEGIESTVWGSNTCDISTFPNGWTMGTLTTIWKRGWEDPVACQGLDNADDFTGQYSFPGAGFRYIAVHADYSVSIFDDPTHTTWSSFFDDSPLPGWQSHDDEIDAIGTPTCTPGQVVADAGPPQTANVGGQVCFDAINSTAGSGIASYGWDLDGDGAIDVSGPQACVSCTQGSVGQVTLFVTDACGCVDSTVANYTCVDSGACCDSTQLPGQVCTDNVSSGSCTASFYQGDTCANIQATGACVSDIPAVSEWGLVILLLLGLTFGTAMFRRTATA